MKSASRSSISSRSWRSLLPLCFAIVVMAGSCSGGDDELSTTDIDATIDRLNLYWSDRDQDLGFVYQPVPVDRISIGGDGVTCNGFEVREAEVDDNAFVDAECDEGILVAYDPDYVQQNLARLEATLSHEWGHVIQAQAVDLDLGRDDDGLPIDSELQADCFSGAWAATEATAEVDAMRGDLSGAGDDEDVDVSDNDAHGSSEERLLAFDVGFAGGPVACVNELLDVLP